ncbi:MAG TPA: acetate--CoA ligase [Ilumatobacteraceae bacterium]|nr:acetate--CoA ligase [Ilumatobacteraceae bacterium]
MGEKAVVQPWLVDYDAETSSFSWEDGWDDLGGRPEGRFNITDRIVDRHVRSGRGDHVAIRWFSQDDHELSDPVDITYEVLAHRTNRFASALHTHGFGVGTGVATLAGREPDLYVAALGTLKAGAVYSPLFAAFGPDPIAQRVMLGHIEVLVTSRLAYRRKIARMLDRLPTVRLVLITGVAEDEAEALAVPEGPQVMSFGRFLADGHDAFDAAPTDVDSPALVHFTSGTTGTPKGAVHVHGAVLTHFVTGRLVLDLHPDDVYWCTADPGWVTGTSYGIISPLANGVTAIVDEAEFDADRWYRMIDGQHVDVFYTAPTAIRLLERLGADAADPYDFASLRLVASVGEPLDAESVSWCRQVFGVPVVDTWWQTETGGIMVANFRSQPVRPGSMGRPVPGVEVGLLRRTADGELELDGDGDPIVVDDPDTTGELAIRAGWPSMFRTYLDQEDRYERCFVDGWYRSGDMARRDADGYYWFVGRGDDVIKTAGHLIGPFEVESAMNEHPAVVETGVIGKPDATAGSIIKAFVVLGNGVEPSDELARELIGHGRQRLGAAVAPREIEIVDRLPHTRSGKIMRRVLTARELGLDEGDTSTLETIPDDRRPS